MRKLSLFFMVLILIMSTIIVTSNVIEGNVNASTALNDLSAKSYIVVDMNGNTLLENNPDEKKPVASICKLMTTLITFENIEKGNLTLDDKLLASQYACSAEGSQAFLDAGSEYSVRDLLKSVIVASANDSAIVLAEGIAGSEDAFVSLMNSRAKELGMTNTLYANSTGLTNGKNQYSTARDTSKILNEISNYELYAEDCMIWMDSMIHPSGRKTELVNTNRLIKYYTYTLTGKTGFTDEAKYCLSSTAMKDNLKLCCVVLGCDSSADRFSDSVALYNHAYANFKSEKVIDSSIEIANEISVKKGKSSELSAVADKDYYLTLPRNGKGNYSIDYDFVDAVSAPVNIGDKVGIAKVIVDGVVIDEVNLVSNVNIEKQSFKDVLSKIAENYSIVK